MPVIDQAEAVDIDRNDRGFPVLPEIDQLFDPLIEGLAVIEPCERIVLCPVFHLLLDPHLRIHVLEGPEIAHRLTVYA